MPTIETLKMKAVDKAVFEEVVGVAIKLRKLDDVSERAALTVDYSCIRW